MVEQEIKVLLSQETIAECERILSHMAFPRNFLQINYYYDNPDFFLNSIGDTLRIRQNDDQLLLQYKHKMYHDGRIKSNEEYEASIKCLPKYITDESLPYKQSSTTSTYSLVGILVTERSNYEFDGIIVSIDKNYYLGKLDYEVEIEFQDYNKAMEIAGLLPLIEQGIQNEGKYTRYVKEYKRLENEV